MILQCALLALSASIDALSIGVTYGIKDTKISKLSNIIIFLIVFALSSASIFIGNYISLIFSPFISGLLGSSLLILLGLYNIYKRQNILSSNFDIDNSNYIDIKESFILSFAVAIDASCVSLSSGMIGLGTFILPIFMGFFHTFFVNCGNFIASSIVKKFKLSNKSLSTIAGTILIFIGLLRIISLD